MKIIAHDEDSMTNLFFSEIHYHEKLKDFLALINWRSHSSMPFDLIKAELHQQINFSEFGRPDAIILVTDSQNQKHVVIVEVKLGKYLNACISTKNRKFNNKFNSRLNNQLALKYRAMLSLRSIPDKGYITELNHDAESPYSEDQIRRCKKPSTIAFSSDLLTADFQFYLVTLTSDTMAPLSEDSLALSDPCFPLLFNQQLHGPQEYLNLGSVLWDQCYQLFDGINCNFPDSYMLHFGAVEKTGMTENLEEDEYPIETTNQAELFVKSRQIIRYDGKICHLSCRGYSFAIRHFRNGKFVTIYRGQNDREKYLGLKNQIRILKKAPRVTIIDTQFWATYFQNFTMENQ